MTASSGANPTTVRIANHEFAAVKNLTNDNIEIVFDNGRRLKLPVDQARHIDFGYATTSHALQGATVDREIAHIDSRRSVDLINRGNSMFRPAANAKNFASIPTTCRVCAEPSPASKTRSWPLTLCNRNRVRHERNRSVGTEYCGGRGAPLQTRHRKANAPERLARSQRYARRHLRN